MGNIAVSGPISGPSLSANNSGSAIHENGTVQGGSITTHGSVTGNITLGGALAGPTLSANNNASAITLNGLVQGGSITTYGSITTPLFVTGPLIGTVFSANNGGVIQANVPVQGGSILTGGNLSDLTVGGPLSGRVVTIGNMNGSITLKGPLQGGVIAAGGAINGNLSIGGPIIDGQIVSIGDINGNVTISGPLQDGHIASQGSILGNVTIGGAIDSWSAIVAGGSIGGPTTKLTAVNIYGIVAAEGTINAGALGSTNAAIAYRQKDIVDAAAINAVFTAGLSTALSPTDLLDHGGPLDLTNLGPIQHNLSSVASTILATLTGVTVTGGVGLETISWSQFAGAVSYDLYRGITPGGEGSIPFKTGITSTSYVDTGVADGTTYYYVVRANSSSRSGAISTEAQGATVAAVYKNFVTHIFNDLLHRAPNAAELSYWAAAIQAGAVTDPQFVTAVTTSQEYRATEATLIYKALVGAAPSAATLASMVQELTNGLTLETVMAIQLASTTFANYANTLPGATSDQNGNFVKALFTELFGRSPSSSELTYWTYEVGIYGRYNLATMFLGSSEFRFDALSATFAPTPLPANAFVHIAVPDLLQRATSPQLGDISNLVFSNMSLLSLEQAVAEGSEYFNKP